MGIGSRLGGLCISVTIVTLLLLVVGVVACRGIVRLEVGGVVAPSHTALGVSRSDVEGRLSQTVSLLQDLLSSLRVVERDKSETPTTEKKKRKSQ